MRVGCLFLTSKDSAGAELVQNTLCQRNQWDIKSTSFLLCHLKVLCGFHRHNATQTRTWCRCSCRSCRMSSLRSMEQVGGIVLFCWWMEPRTIDPKKLGGVSSTLVSRSFWVHHIHIKPLQQNYGSHISREVTSTLRTSRHQRGKCLLCCWFFSVRSSRSQVCCIHTLHISIRSAVCFSTSTLSYSCSIIWCSNLFESIDVDMLDPTSFAIDKTWFVSGAARLYLQCQHPMTLFYLASSNSIKWFFNSNLLHLKMILDF